MWCPSVSLSLWANAWLAGMAAPDDVLDSLSLWAPVQSVTAYDAVAAGHTGLPWPDVHDAGTVSLLQTLRAAVGRTTPAPGGPDQLRGTINVVLPVPGDVRGLAAGTQFERDALAAGEAVIITNPDDPGTAVGLVPEFAYSDLEETDAPDDGNPEPPELYALSWIVYSLPGAPPFEHHELGDAEYALRSAVRSAVPSAWEPPHPTSQTHADLSNNCWNPRGNTGFRTTRRRGRCGYWRTPRTSTRSSRSARG
jgi:hypothetical protein